MSYPVLIVLLLAIVGTQAFWDVGHMLTADIARIKLEQEDPAALAKFTSLVQSINFLTDNRTHTFIEASVWPDDIKESKYKMHLWDSWHFGDTPHVVDTVSPVINYTEAVFSSIHAVQTAAKVLKTNIERNTVERALYARYLLHLAGDIHQPLHSVALFNRSFPAGDIGGNRLKVIILNGSQKNFHQFWDSGAYLIQNDSFTFKRPLNQQNTSLLREIAESYIQEFGKDVEQQGQVIDPIVWAQQAFEIAKAKVYPYVAKTNVLNEAYTMQTYNTLRRQITLAGYRLANFIKDIYTPANIATSRVANSVPVKDERDHGTEIYDGLRVIVKKLLGERELTHPHCKGADEL